MIKDVEAELSDHLNTNENLIWTGQPKQGIVFRSMDIIAIPFMLFWWGFFVFWTIMVYQQCFLFAIVALPFHVVGFVFVIGRFFIDAKHRENVFYGLTSERIIIKSGIFTKSVKSFNIATLTNIEYSEKKDGSGTIAIGSKTNKNPWEKSIEWMPGMKPNPRLNLIKDARMVYSKIIQLQRENLKTNQPPPLPKTPLI